MPREQSGSDRPFVDPVESKKMKEIEERTTARHGFPRFGDTASSKRTGGPRRGVVRPSSTYVTRLDVGRLESSGTQSMNESHPEG